MPVSQRTKSFSPKAVARCFCHRAGAERSPRVAFSRINVISPHGTPIFSTYSAGGRAKTSRRMPECCSDAREITEPAPL
eukprot:12464542-Alexandrium_andersonii.AAC.1